MHELDLETVQGWTAVEVHCPHHPALCQKTPHNGSSEESRGSGHSSGHQGVVVVVVVAGGKVVVVAGIKVVVVLGQVAS